MTDAGVELAVTRGGVGLPQFARRPVAAVVVIQALVLTVSSNGYGFHRDELYFLAAGRRLDWGYVDQPPLTPLIARMSTAVFGDSPAGLRVAATLCGVVTVVVAALIAREFGGDRAAQVFTAIATALSGFVVVVSHILVTASVDLVVWTVLAWLTLRLLRSGDGRWWIAIGAVVAVGMSNKWLVPLLAVSLTAAAAVLGPRRALAGWWPLVGVGVAVVLTLPVIVWQARNGWPLLTVAGGISSKDGASNRVVFVPAQLLFLSPVLVPAMVGGWVRLWREPALRWARAFPLGYLILCGALLLLGGKPYYSVPLLLVFVAAGADGAVRALRRMGTAARVVTGAAFAAGAAISILIGLPVLPPQALNGPVLAVNKELGEQVGWQRLVATVAGVWRQIPPDQRSRAVIFAENYGEAGAVERYGARYGLPQPFSGHMSYYSWGPPTDAMTGPVVLIREPSKSTYLLDDFTACHVAAQEDNGYGLQNEEHATEVWLCSRPNRPWSRLWNGLRHYY